MSEDIIIQTSPFGDWYADQDVPRGVSFHDRATGRKVTVEPPAEWGRHWSWNLTEDAVNAGQKPWRRTVENRGARDERRLYCNSGVKGKESCPLP